MKKKKFKDIHGKTRVGMFLKHKAPQLLDIASDLLPDGGLLGGLGDIIDGSDMNEEDKAMAKEFLNFDLENTADARAMQKAALEQDDLFSKRFVYYLASFWSVIGALYIFLSTFFEVANPRVLDTVLGFLLGTIVASVINYFFGSSKGSKDKQDHLHKIKDLF